MKTNDVKVGETYTMRHSSGRIQVRILSIVERSPCHSLHVRRTRTMTHWSAINLKTGRNIEIKSAVKLSAPLPAGV